MTTFFHFHIFPSYLLFFFCFRCTHSVFHIRSHPFAYKTLRCLTRSTMLQYVHEPLLPPEIRACGTLAYKCVLSSDLKCKNVSIGKSEDLWKRDIPRRYSLLCNERSIQKRNCACRPIFRITDSFAFSKEYKYKDSHARVNLKPGQNGTVLLK